MALARRTCRIRPGQQPYREAVVPKPVSKSPQAGFTTIEAAVSLTVLAVALLALWGTLIYCSRSNLASEQKKQALNAAQQTEQPAAKAA